MESVVFHDKRERLFRIKNKIDECVLEWETIKHDINPLEFVFTFGKDRSVSSVSPVSRAFFKMVELLKLMPALPMRPMRTLHLAESPGGFIQALTWVRKKQGFIDYSVGWTLRKERTWTKLEDTIKTWSSKPVLRLGDLLKESVRKNIISSHSTEKAFVITGDGGFDFSKDYKNQESMALPLILAQMNVGLECLEKGGSFVLKIFDCFTLPTIQLLWVFWRVFGGFRVVKPATSRACNSEKYIIGRDFKGIRPSLRSFLNRCEKILVSQERGVPQQKKYTHTLFEGGKASSWDTMEPEFKQKFVNVIGGMIDAQTYWIQKGLDGYRIPKEDKVTMAKEWCRKHTIPIHHEYYEKHELIRISEGIGWQEVRPHFSLRRRLTSDSPPFSY